MRAMLSRERGGPRALQMGDMPIPEPKHGEVRINVAAVGVNFPDLLIIEDKYQFRPPRPFCPGGEVAGTVDAVGDGVAGLKVGDRVLAITLWGGLAEAVVAPTKKVFCIPDVMPFDDASAFLMTYGTSWYALRDRANLCEGETLLVLGAAGGVGLAAVELGKAMGARVVAAASSQEKLEVAKRAGADCGLVYPSGSLDKSAQKALSEKFKEICGPGGANVIYDPVGGGYSEAAIRSIAWEGHYLVVGFPAGVPEMPLNLPLLKGCNISGIFWGAAIDRDPIRSAAATTELVHLYETGKIKPHIHARFPLNDAADALEMLASRTSSGKIVVTV
ncbi:NADPH:quinone oxidoreductase family protein [Ensifer sp. ENS07]|uniref:NADPH:quinone oxidoreductase family protein n=1 Tax=Ensifer sp. ENS07 TaxID=2769274 RepID=UPI001786377C|nr:NADPH:quinone oxidoreductase family protein [Ensifer sp. ENS07]